MTAQEREVVMKKQENALAKRITKEKIARKRSALKIVQDMECAQKKENVNVTMTSSEMIALLKDVLLIARTMDYVLMAAANVNQASVENIAS